MAVEPGTERGIGVARFVGDVYVRDRAAGSVEIEVELPEEGIGAALRETLRAAGRGLVRMRVRTAASGRRLAPSTQS